MAARVPGSPREYCPGVHLPSALVLGMGRDSGKAPRDPQPAALHEPPGFHQGRGELRLLSKFCFVLICLRQGLAMQPGQAGLQLLVVLLPRLPIAGFTGMCHYTLLALRFKGLSFSFCSPTVALAACSPCLALSSQHPGSGLLALGASDCVIRRGIRGLRP